MRSGRAIVGGEAERGGDLPIEPREVLANKFALALEFGEPRRFHVGHARRSDRTRQKKKRRKNPALGKATKRESRSGESSARRDDFDATVRLVVFDRTVLQREEGPIATNADVLAGMEFGAALTNDDAAGDDGLAAKFFHAEPLRVALASVH